MSQFGFYVWCLGLSTLIVKALARSTGNPGFKSHERCIVFNFKKYEQVNVITVIQNCKLFLDAMQDDIKFLKFRNEPFEEIIKKWNSTFEIRSGSKGKY